MNYRQLMNQTVTSLLDKGADKVQLWLNISNTEEFNVIFKELNLLRTLENLNLSISVIKDNRNASTNINQLDEASLQKAIDDIMVAVEAANEDPAFDISPHQEKTIKVKGPQRGDLDKICVRLEELTAKIKQKYPTVLFDAILSYVNDKTLYLNSNETDFEETKGCYQFTLMFSAKEGDKMSSLNYLFYSLKDLDEDLMSKNFTELSVKQITEQTTTNSIPENFSGEILLMPIVTAELIASTLESNIGNNPLLFKTSRFPDHLEKKIFDEKLTVHTKPLDEEMVTSSYFLSDGYIAENATIIDKGVLKHYPISIYAANKTGMKRTIGPNKSYQVETGDTSYNDIIAKVKKGVLCARLSYGKPNSNGDFSGVLKNSYYIEDGKIKYPISETMMSANLVDMFNNIEEISQETINTGSMEAPFMLIKDVYISKK